MKIPTSLLGVISIKQICLLLLSLALGIAFVGNVTAPSAGLDPSWQLGLSQAHAEELKWGKDIIFTFGPFGYLFYGSLVEKNFLEMQVARYILSFLWIFYSLSSALRFQSLIFKIIGVLCFVFIPSLANNIESQFFLLIQLIILDIFNLYKKEFKISAGFKLYLYGIISVFLLLVKSSFGILAVLSFSTIVLFNGFFQFKRNNLAQALYPIAWLFFGCLVGFNIFFSSLANSPSFAILIACLPGAMLGFLLSFAEVQNFLFRKNYSRISFLVALTVLLSLAVLLAVSNSNLREFIVGSLSISSGYSQSMSAIGPEIELYIGFTLLAIMAALAITAIICNRSQNTGTALALLALAWVSFKHGFIRHDGHALGFAISAPAYIFNFSALIFPYLASKSLIFFKSVFFSIIGFCAVLIIGFGTENSSISKYYNFNLKEYVVTFFHPQALYGRLLWLAQPNSTEANLLDQRTLSLEPSVITSKAVLSRVKGKTVDIVPVEISVAAANSLEWHPSPIFQAYAAYTRWLDHKNLKAYKDDPPERIIYSFQTIDGRHPYFDQPRTTLFQICHFSPIQFKAQPTIDSTGEIAVLRERQTPLCSLDDIVNVGPSLAIDWGESLNLNDIRDLYNQEYGNLLIASIDLKYSLLGKLYNLLLRTPPVYLKAIYDNGFNFDFRLIIDNAKSGIIIGHLPLNFQESLRDFYGYDSLNKLRSFSLSSPNDSVFVRKISVQFSRLKKRASLPKDFNSARYLKINPDLDIAGSGLNPKEHFLTYGFFQGRRYK